MGPVDPAADVPMVHAAAVLALGDMSRDVAGRLGISVADLFARVARAEDGGLGVSAEGARFLLDGLGCETLAEARRLCERGRAAVTLESDTTPVVGQPYILPTGEILNPEAVRGG